MGKQKRPRRRNKDNNKKKAPPPFSSPSSVVKNDANNKQEDSSSTAAVAVAASTTTTSALLGKIRHANAQTRLAVLCALQQNVLIGQNSSNNNNNNNTSTLWQAVREQVLDQTDLAVATTAATCLTEFIVATTTECCSSSSTSTSSSSNHHPMTAGWFLVLMGRLQECHAQQLQQQSANSGGSNNKQQQWLALSLQCLHAICALLETNPLVMERLERTASLRNDSLDTLWQWLDTASSIQQQQTTKTGATAADTSTTTTSTPMDTTTTTSFSTNGFDYWKEIQEQACRALHSMTEENWSTLLLPWLLQEPKEEQEISMAHCAFTEIGPRILHPPAQTFHAQSAVAVAAAVAATADSATTTTVQEDSSLQVARLHMAGIYLSCHFDSARSKDNNATPAAAATTAIIARMEKEMTSVLDVLKRGLVWTKYSRNNDHLIANLCMAHAQYTKQTLDDVLERDILRRQDDKKESARAIARRLQAVKQQQQQQHNDEQDDDKRAQFAEDRTDALQLWQETVAQWYTSIQPLELALEIFANLTLSMSSNNSDNDDDDEIMHVDDMDDDDIDNDDRIMHPSSSNAVSNSIVGKSLLQQDADGLVNRIITVLQQLCQTNATLCQSGDAILAIRKSENDDDAAAAMMMDVSSSSSSPPAIVAESLGFLQSKAAAGIGHCLLAFPAASCWLDVEPQATPEHDHDAGSVVTISSSAFSLWTFLKQCLEQASTAVGRQGIASTMVVALQSRPLLRKQLQAPDLNLLLSLLTTTTTTTQATTTSVPNKDDNMDESSSMSSYHLVRDVVFMLGMLCSPEDNPVEVKEKVCRALLQTLSENCNNTNASASSSKNADASIKSNNNNNIEGSIVVVTEILNVLMDMYGSDDDALAMMFSSLDVLGHFQRTLPLLKQQISVYSSTNRGGGGQGNNVEDADLLEGWKETAMNASRFIQYKKEHC